MTAMSIDKRAAREERGALDEHIHELVDAAPPLSEAQRSALAVLLQAGVAAK